MPQAKSAWAPDRALTNAKFEGYKLSFSDDEDDEPEGAGENVLDRGLRHIQLDSQSALPGRSLRGGSDSRLGYKQARSRARWNHFTPGPEQTAAWIDGDGALWMIDFAVSASRYDSSITRLTSGN